MKILLVGGTGVFGSRLAKLLTRDGHHVTLAARNLERATALAGELGCSATQFDRKHSFGRLGIYDVVVDAAGPYYAYGNDPYHLAREAIASGTHYLDLADNAAFCAGIVELDKDACDAGVCVLSGVSSVPALSSAAVRALTGDEQPDMIECAILPGNRSPRGRSVMASILSQTGRPIMVWRGKKWTRTTGWSDPKEYALPGGLTRQGWQIEVPDQRLFPEHFRAGSVVFRAGLELSVMRYGLWVLACLRRWLPIPINRPVLSAFKIIADTLSPFGSDRGGMWVSVTVNQQRRWWRLRVEAGDGPFIPAVPARALLRRGSLPIGAQPALEAITLTEATAAMSDLDVTFEQGHDDVAPIFKKVLGAQFEALPAEIRAPHTTTDISRWQGRASVKRGRGFWSRILGAVFGFPKPSDSIDVQVTKTITEQGETWERRFGKKLFRSRLSASPEGLTEKFGPFSFLIGLHFQDDGLHFPVLSGRIGPIPLPKVLLPQSNAREYVKNGKFHFDVELTAPITKGLLVHYQGNLAEAPPEAY